MHKFIIEIIFLVLFQEKQNIIFEYGRCIFQKRKYAFTGL